MRPISRRCRLRADHAVMYVALNLVIDILYG